MIDFDCYLKYVISGLSVTGSNPPPLPLSDCYIIDIFDGSIFEFSGNDRISHMVNDTPA